jgi:hypothetical protein
VTLRRQAHRGALPTTTVVDHGAVTRARTQCARPNCARTECAIGALHRAPSSGKIVNVLEIDCEMGICGRVE